MKIVACDVVTGFILFTILSILIAIALGAPAAALCGAIGAALLSLCTLITALLRTTFKLVADPVRHTAQAVRNPAHTHGQRHYVRPIFVPIAVVATITLLWLINHWLDGQPFTIAEALECITLTVCTLGTLVAFEQLNRI